MRVPRTFSTACAAVAAAVAVGALADVSAGPALADASSRSAGVAVSADLLTQALRWQADALTRDGLLTREQALAVTSAARSTQQGGLPRSAVRASAAQDAVAADHEPEGGVLVFPGGDLDGNGSADVLESRSVTARDRTTLGVVVRSGGTGRVVWSKRIPVASGHFAFALPLNVGTPARPGVVVVDVGFEERESEVLITDRLTGLRGRDGAALWSHADRGSLSGDEETVRGTHVPQLLGSLRAAGGADDLLLGFSDFVVTDSGADSTTEPTPTGSLDVFVVRATNGRAQRLGARTTSATGVPVATGVSDLDGDRGDDVVVSAPGDSSSGASGAVEARRSTDGGRLWRTELSVDVEAPVLSVGALSGAQAGGRQVEDVAVVVRRPGTAASASPTSSGSASPTSTGRPLPLPLPAPGSSGSASPSPTPSPTTSPTTSASASAPASEATPSGEPFVQLLRGSDGAPGTAVPGDAPVRLLRAGTPLEPALGTSTTTTTTADGVATVTLRLAAFDTEGTRLYARDRSLRAPGQVGFGSAGTDGDDLQRDGSLDGTVSLTVLGGSGPSTSQAVFDGATGTPVAGRPLGLLGGSVTGTGSDLGRAPLADSGRTVDVRLVRGRDRVQLTRTLLRPRAALTTSTVSALAPRARRSDVLVLGQGGRTAYMAVLDAAGKVRWTDEHALTDLTPAAPRR